MQPKVSIVIPCYNKEKYIGAMFNSIISQNWDNIELIIVNDGSTDGTSEIIASYELEFKNRGFEVVIINQKNRGVAAAVHEGLKRISGEFVCQIDADDELDSQYISTMACWLSDNPDYDWAVCDMLYVYSDCTFYKSWFNSERHKSFIFSNIAESYLLSKITDTVHEYMVRTSYLKRSGLVENYYFDIRSTQEPQFIIPLGFHGGKIKHFPLPLYRYMQNDSMMTRKDNPNHFIHYFQISEKTINGLSTTEETKNKLISLAKTSYHRRSYKKKSPNILLDYLNSLFAPSPNLTKNDLFSLRCLFAAVDDCILNFKPSQNFKDEIIPADYDRIIGWGALGMNGRELLPCLEDTALKPTTLWDIEADDINVKKPDISSLTEKDMVLIFPQNFDVAAKILSDIKKSNCKTMCIGEITQYISIYYVPQRFPQFYNGSFSLKGD